MNQFELLNYVVLHMLEEFTNLAEKLLKQTSDAREFCSFIVILKQ